MLFPCIPSCVPYTSAATLPQSKRSSGTDSSWWVSVLDPGAEAFLGQLGEGTRQGIIFSQSLIRVSTCYCTSVPLWACESGHVGWWLRWWRWQGIIWTPTAAVVSLCSFVGMQTSFLSHNLIVNAIYSLLFPAKSSEFVFLELSQPLTEWEEDRLTELITAVSKKNRAPDLSEIFSLKQALPLFKDLSPEESSFLSYNKDLLKQCVLKENTSDACEPAVQVSVWVLLDSSPPVGIHTL